MRQEDGPVLDAFEACGGGERALLAIAPRHPERFPEVETLIRSRTGRLARRSSRGSPSDESRPDVVLLDTVGELAALYRLATGAFIGGTLVPTGGHNPLEAAHFAVPIAAGPSMENFRAIAGLFDEAAAWERVHDAVELAAVWKRWLDDPEEARRSGRRGRELLRAHRGALERTVEALAPILGPLLASSAPPASRLPAQVTERGGAAS
jgi:3-deoxy-D-manno-octulosonic-acid transferase